MEPWRRLKSARTRGETLSSKPIRKRQEPETDVVSVALEAKLGSLVGDLSGCHGYKDKDEMCGLAYNRAGLCEVEFSFSWPAGAQGVGKRQAACPEMLGGSEVSSQSGFRRAGSAGNALGSANLALRLALWDRLPHHAEATCGLLFRGHLSICGFALDRRIRIVFGWPALLRRLFAQHGRPSLQGGGKEAPETMRRPSDEFWELGPKRCQKPNTHRSG